MKLLLFFFTTVLIRVECERRIGQGIEIDDATRFPFFAQLQRPFRNHPNRMKKCGGSLIHPQWILTAGHCFPRDIDSIKWMLSQKIEMVFMGSAKSYNSTYAKTNTFKAIHHHPQYRPVRVAKGMIAENDIAVGQLTNSYFITPTVQTIRLAAAFRICNKGIMVGVGRTDESDPDSAPKHVKYAELYIKNAKDIDFNFYKTPTIFYTDSEKDENKFTRGGYALPGDSGGPFFCKISSQPVQVGVFAAGGPTNTTIFGIYERVDKHLDFIFTYVPDINYVRALMMKGDTSIKEVCHGVLIFCIIFIFFGK